jgi:hypothetical protein
MVTLRRILSRMLRTPNWPATPPEQNVVDVVATVSAGRDVVADYYLTEEMPRYEYTGVSHYPTTMSWEERATCAARDAASKIILLTPTIIEDVAVTAPVAQHDVDVSWEERAASAAADAARTVAEWPTCVPQEHETPLEQNIIDDVVAAPAPDVDDDDYLSEDADDEVAVQDDEMVEEEPVVAIVMIVAPPLRRSKRIAAQQCKALRSAVAPSPYAITGLRRSARLAALPRVNYKY